MSRQTTTNRLSLVAAMVLLSPAPAADDSRTLRTNPFSNPYIGDMETTKEEVLKAPAAIVYELRGTMTAGANSQADIDGIILAIGEDIGGYTLVSVGLREVVLDKDGEQKILSLDLDNRNPPNE